MMQCLKIYSLFTSDQYHFADHGMCVCPRPAPPCVRAWEWQQLLPCILTVLYIFVVYFAIKCSVVQDRMLCIFTDGRISVHRQIDVVAKVSLGFCAHWSFQGGTHNVICYLVYVPSCIYLLFILPFVFCIGMGIFTLIFSLFFPSWIVLC